MGLFVGTLAIPTYSSAASEQELRDVILERTPLQSGSFAEFDINGDGMVDVADLVASNPHASPFLSVNAADEALGFDYMFGDHAGNLMVLNASRELGYSAIYFSPTHDPLYFEFYSDGRISTVSTEHVVIMVPRGVPGSYGIADDEGNAQLLYSSGNPPVEAAAVMQTSDLVTASTGRTTVVHSMLRNVTTIIGEFSDLFELTDQLHDIKNQAQLRKFFKDQANGLIAGKIKDKIKDNTLDLLLDSAQSPFSRQILDTLLGFAKDALACSPANPLSCLNAAVAYSGLMDAALDALLGSAGAIDDLADFMSSCMSPPLGIFAQFGCTFACELEPRGGYCPDQDSSGGTTPYYCVISGRGCILKPDRAH